ncbi:unnamed protein product, partial [Nesidiocoris tenuis]
MKTQIFARAPTNAVQNAIKNVNPMQRKKAASWSRRTYCKRNMTFSQLIQRRKAAPGELLLSGIANQASVQLKKTAYLPNCCTALPIVVPKTTEKHSW